MAKKQQNYEAKPYANFESYGYIKNGKHYFMPILGDTERVDSPITLTMAMLSHPAFKDLTPKQRLLYMYAKSQYKAMVDRTKFEEDYPQFKGKPEYIYLNHKLMIDVFEMYPKSSARLLYKDITALTEHGFLQPVLDESNQRKVYKLIAEWQNWQPHLKYLPKFGKSQSNTQIDRKKYKKIKQTEFEYEWR